VMGIVTPALSIIATIFDSSDGRKLTSTSPVANVKHSSGSQW
jgi:hypothetical protein